MGGEHEVGDPSQKERRTVGRGDNEEGDEDDMNSQVTFNLSNLNYVKKKLFDPEIQYLRTKCREEFEDLSN